MSDDLKLFAGAGILTAVFALTGAILHIDALITCAISGFSALVGAAAMKMRGNS